MFVCHPCLAQSSRFCASNCVCELWHHPASTADARLSSQTQSRTHFVHPDSLCWTYSPVTWLKLSRVEAEEDEIKSRDMDEGTSPEEGEKQGQGESGQVLMHPDTWSQRSQRFFWVCGGGVRKWWERAVVKMGTTKGHGNTLVRRKLFFASLILIWGWIDAYLVWNCQKPKTRNVSQFSFLYLFKYFFILR